MVLAINVDNTIASPVRALPAEAIDCFSADVDEKGHLWILCAGSRWYQIDLSTRNILDQGTSPPLYACGDWAYVPGGGDFLYTVLVSDNEEMELWRFDRTLHTWGFIGPNDPLRPRGYGYFFLGNALFFGAIFASAEGYLFATAEDDTDGYLFQFELDGENWVPNFGAQYFALDGAHCIDN